MRGLAGRNVLVTGGSSGIGQAIAVRLGREGANVAINYRQEREKAENTAVQVREAVQQCADELRRCGGRTALLQADVSREDDCIELVRRASDELGGLDTLINNAGIQMAADSHEMEVEEFDRVLAVNLRGAFLCAREALRRWVGAGRTGVIINVTSVHEIIPKPRFVSYSASKGAMGNLTRTLALEYAGRGIRVNGVGPGATITPINRSWVEDGEKRQEVERHIPMRRAGEAEEIAAAVAFLCSEDAAYITGQTLYVDGGLTLYPAFREPWSSE